MANVRRHRDRLSISKIMVIMAGIAAGLTLFSPESGGVTGGSAGAFRDWCVAFLIGLSLPGIVYPIYRAARFRRIGLGATLWLTLAVGALLMLPPILANKMSANPNTAHVALACTYYVMPMTALWFTLAILVSAQGQRIFCRSTAWTERFGFIVGLCWCPIGVWFLFDIYWISFSR